MQGKCQKTFWNTFPEKKIWHFMQSARNVKSCFLGNKEDIINLSSAEFRIRGKRSTYLVLHCVFCKTWVLQPFQEYFTYSELIVHKGGQNPENPGKNHLTIRKQNLAFPHMTWMRLEPQWWETLWIKSQLSYPLGYGGPHLLKDVSQMWINKKSMKGAITSVSFSVIMDLNIRGDRNEYP